MLGVTNYEVTRIRLYQSYYKPTSEYAVLNNTWIFYPVYEENSDKVKTFCYDNFVITTKSDDPGINR